MVIEQKVWRHTTGWQTVTEGNGVGSPSLVLAFGGRHRLAEPEYSNDAGSIYPGAPLLSCSTSGEISGTAVFDDSLVLTAIWFNNTPVAFVQVNIHDVADSFTAGQQLARNLPTKGLVHVLLFSDGQLVNGSSLVRGIASLLPATVTVTGGMAGDGSRFQKTLVGINAPPVEGNIIAVGFYGESLRVGYGSVGGWDSFGPERLVTKSSGNILYEVDGRPALELYKKYLGSQADALPGSALLFPLSIRSGEIEHPIVRTVLSVNEAEGSMTFAGDMPEGAYARLMKANFDRLIDGAADAANRSYERIGSVQPQLALLISCVGRKLVLDQRVEEEIEGVRDILGPGATLCGFYSYGEISPFVSGARCELHNQTMTVTTFREE